MSKWITSCPLDINPSSAPGVYCLYTGDRLIYVGQSRDLRKRILYNHMNSFDAVIDLKNGETRVKCWLGEFDGKRQITWKYKYEDKLGRSLMDEYRLINRLRPMCNKIGNSKGGFAWE